MSDSFSGTVTELGSEAGASTVTEPLDPDAPPPRPKPTKLYSWRARNPDAELLYIRDVDVANLELDRLSTLSAVGFDQEWRPTFIKGLPENPVSLIQLASDELVLLIQVSAMNEIPEKLIQILENPDIVKAGVGIQGDVHKLYKDHKVNVKNCVDLSLLARSADNPRWKGKYNSSIGLARLIEEYEDETLQKGKITRSNWEAILSTAQQLYAANDAHAGLTLYNRLGAMARSIDTLKPVYYTFDCVRGRLCEPSGAQWYAWNPNYDPGPPPPPRPPKPPKIKEFPSGANTTLTPTTITSPSSLTLSSSSPSSAHPISGPSSTNTTIVSTNANSHTPANVNNFTKVLPKYKFW
ncbi:3'-5' exonuclease [Pleurotus pulmonarius]